MKKRQLYILGLISIVLFACERRPLDEAIYTKALIPVKAYWDLAEITPRNATVMVYDQNGDLYLEKSFSSENEFAYSEILLDPGIYTVFVFNEIRNQIVNVNMRGHEKLSTFEAYVVPSSKVYSTKSRTDGDRIVTQPEILAVSKIDNFVVTWGMVTRSHYLKAGATTVADALTQAGTRGTTDEMIGALIDLHPHKKVSNLSVTAHVLNLNYALMPALTEIRNLAEGYLFATDENSYVPVTTQFLMNNRTYDAGSNRDGTISQVITTFGVLGKRGTVGDTPGNSVLFNLSFKLIDDATLVERFYDVTNSLVINEKKTEMSLELHVEVEKLPEVKPVGGGSGMTTDVEDWANETITIEL